MVPEGIPSRLRRGWSRCQPLRFDSNPITPPAISPASVTENLLTYSEGTPLQMSGDNTSGSSPLPPKASFITPDSFETLDSWVVDIPDDLWIEPVEEPTHAGPRTRDRLGRFMSTGSSWEVVEFDPCSGSVFSHGMIGNLRGHPKAGGVVIGRPWPCKDPECVVDEDKAGYQAERMLRSGDEAERVAGRSELEVVRIILSTTDKSRRDATRHVVSYRDSWAFAIPTKRPESPDPLDQLLGMVALVTNPHIDLYTRRPLQNLVPDSLRFSVLPSIPEVFLLDGKTENRNEGVFGYFDLTREWAVTYIAGAIRQKLPQHKTYALSLASSDPWQRDHANQKCPAYNRAMPHGQRGFVWNTVGRGNQIPRPCYWCGNSTHPRHTAKFNTAPGEKLIDHLERKGYSVLDHIKGKDGTEYIKVGPQKKSEGNTDED